MLREAVHDDAKNLSTLMQQVERESPYMLDGGMNEVFQEKSNPK